MSALPPDFEKRAFMVGEAMRAGIGRGRLRGRDLNQPYYGVRAPADIRPTEAYAPRLRPGDRFSHSTAAELWGAPVPRRHEGLVHVASPPGADRPRADGVIGHRSGSPEFVLRAGRPVSTPVTLFLELGSILTIDELVAVGDYLVLDPRVLDPDDPRPHVPMEVFRTSVAAAHGIPGVRRARTAAALVRAGVESPRETGLRLLLQRAGLPEPLCGYELRCANGARVGWFDLAWPEFRVIAEYDGDQHRTSRAQYERDIRRFDDASDMEWRVVRVRAGGLDRGNSDTIARVSDALRRAGYESKGRRSTG